MANCPHCGQPMPQASLELTAPIVAESVATLPLVNGQTYPVYQEIVDVFVAAYPGVNIMAEFPRMRAWLMSNPRNGKTAKGMQRFMNNWLTKAQDNPRSNGNGNGQTGNRYVEAEREQLHRVARAGRS